MGEGPTAWNEHLSESPLHTPRKGLPGSPGWGAAPPAVCEPAAWRCGILLEGAAWSPGLGVTTGALDPQSRPRLATHGAQEAPGSLFRLSSCRRPPAD